MAHLAVSSHKDFKQNRENLHPAIQAQNFLCSYPKDPELGSCRNPTHICGLLSTQSPFFSYKVFISL